MEWRDARIIVIEVPDMSFEEGSMAAKQGRAMFLEKEKVLR